MRRYFPFLIAITALLISFSAAYFSVDGLRKVFSGAAVSSIIIFGSLEIAKLVIATFLHQYRKEASKILKYYLSTALIILIIITSIGIYGFLSNAYKKTSVQNEITQKQTSILDTKKKGFESQKSELEKERASVIDGISNLRSGLLNNTRVEYIDRKTGQKVSSTSNSSRVSFETQLKDAISRRDIITERIQTLQDSIVSIEIQVIQAEINNEALIELGSLIYISNILNIPIDKVLNWFLIILVLVFDPLAISLVLAANFAFSLVSNNIQQIKKTPSLRFEEEEIQKSNIKKVRTKSRRKRVQTSPQERREDILKKENENGLESEVEVEEVKTEADGVEDLYIEEELSREKLKAMTQDQINQWYAIYRKKVLK